MATFSKTTTTSSITKAPRSFADFLKGQSTYTKKAAVPAAKPFKSSLPKNQKTFGVPGAK